MKWRASRHESVWILKSVFVLFFLLCICVSVFVLCMSLAWQLLSSQFSFIKLPFCLLLWLFRLLQFSNPQFHSATHQIHLYHSSFIPLFMLSISHNLFPFGFYFTPKFIQFGLEFPKFSCSSFRSCSL